MTLRLLYNFQQAEPFVPFEIYLADGRVLPITTADFLMTAGDGDTAVVFRPPRTTDFVNPAMITSVRFQD